MGTNQTENNTKCHTKTASTGKHAGAHKTHTKSKNQS